MQAFVMTVVNLLMFYYIIIIAILYTLLDWQIYHWLQFVNSQTEIVQWFLSYLKAHNTGRLDCIILLQFDSVSPVLFAEPVS